MSVNLRPYRWLFLIFALLAPDCQNPPAAPTPYTITGTIKVTNDCDGKLASIPANVTFKAWVTNAAGTAKVGGSANVPLAPVPGGNPVKTGTYTLTVNWGPGLGAASDWTDFDISAGGNPVCKPIPCPAPTTCSNIATWPKTVAVVAPPGNTAQDFDITCACGK